VFQLTDPTTPDPKKSILDSTKKALGLASDYDAFDPELVMHINSVLASLSQLGIGDAEGFAIEGSDEEWDAFLGDDNPLFNNVKSYVYLRVRLLFDIPTNAFAVSAIEKQIQELEWRINVQRETTAWVDPNPPVTVDTWS
jgi:hypothetical protein